MPRTFGSLRAYEPGYMDQLKWGVADAITPFFGGDGKAANAYVQDRLAPVGKTDIKPIEFVSGLGELMSAADSADYFNNGEYLWGTLAAAGAIPILGLPARIAAKSLKGAGKSIKAIKEELKNVKKSTDLPNIRNMDAPTGILYAKQEPHLIPSGSTSEGAYVGGPRNMQNKRQLNRQRQSVDDQLSRGAPSADWYDRQRGGIEQTTDDAVDAYWAANQQGQYSAGVDPSSELGYSVNETNEFIAQGYPSNEPYIKVARPAQKDASLRAVMANDPNAFQLGEKTGEYAHKSFPYQQMPQSATGVNDFRWLREHGFTETSGEAQRNAVGPAGHRYADYETALAADRANQSQAGGFDNWTGEMVQAAPWVAQKADDIFAKREAFYMGRAGNELGADAPADALRQRGWQHAFDDARKSSAEAHSKHTAYATYENQPYAGAGHLMGSLDASHQARKKFADDPRSNWATAPGGRDALYSGYRFVGPEGPTGMATRVRPTQDMQGIYTPPSGATEYNPGRVAMPLVGAKTLDKGGKITSPGSKSMMTGAEAVRAFVDAQGAGAAHKTWAGGPQGLLSSKFLRKATPGPSSPEELKRLENIGNEYGLGDVVDVNEGITVTSFYPEPKNLPINSRKELISKLTESGLYNKATDVSVDSSYISYEGAWEKGSGSDAATKVLLGTLDELPRGVVSSLDNNPGLAEIAMNRIARDNDWAKQWGGTRDDIQKAREIISQGPGWIGRLRDAIGKGILPAGAGVFILNGISSDDEGGA